MPREGKTELDQPGLSEARVATAPCVPSIRQQFCERETRPADEPEVMTAVLGPKPPAQTMAVEDFDKRIIAQGGPIVVLNDEAHHTHDEESEWNKTIRSRRPPRR